MSHLLQFAIIACAICACIAGLRFLLRTGAVKTTLAWCGSALRFLIATGVFLALMVPSRSMRFLVTAALSLGVMLIARKCLASLPPPDESGLARLSEDILKVSKAALFVGLVAGVGLALLMALND